jgi:hypothetical protein
MGAKEIYGRGVRLLKRGEIYPTLVSRTIPARMLRGIRGVIECCFGVAGSACNGALFPAVVLHASSLIGTVVPRECAARGLYDR